MNFSLFTIRTIIALGVIGASLGIASGSTITESFDGVPSPLQFSGNGVLSVSNGSLYGVLDAGSNHRTITISLAGGLMSGFELDLTNAPEDAGSGVNAWINGSLVASTGQVTLFDGILSYYGSEGFSDISLTTNSPSYYGGIREHFLLRSITVWLIQPDLDPELEQDPDVFVDSFLELPDEEGPVPPFGPEPRMASNPEPGTWLMAAAGLVLVGIGRIRRRN